ncbi:hypothetical protein ES708_09267 [subsurface metagenome]
MGRVADATCREYNELKERIRKSGLVYVDETSFSVIGKNQWVWIFRTLHDILLVVRPSRGSHVLKEILGTDYQGKIVCDCWRAYIGNNIGNWFTCIKYEGIEPTNDFAEQALRETVIVRKIIGAFRSENGKHNYETLASLLSSWQLNNFDIKEKLRSTLIKNLCFCSQAQTIA